MTPTSFILFLIVFVALSFVLPYLGTLFVHWISRADFYKWDKRARRYRR
jgi:hypothetical protein